jgi:hypothetical protein
MPRFRFYNVSGYIDIPADNSDQAIEKLTHIFPSGERCRKLLISKDGEASIIVSAQGKPEEQKED